MTAPRISVVIALYNKADFVGAAIESILAGDFLPYEIIVVDDGSTDGGAEWVESIDSPLIKLVRQENAGVSAARNRGIALAQGEFVAFLDADDYWEVDHLRRISLLISRFAGCAIYATSYYLLYPDGQRRLQHLAGEAKTDQPVVIREYFRTRSLSLFFCTCSLAIPRQLLMQHELAFPVGESLGEDQDLWFRLAVHGDVAFDPSASVAYRQTLGASLSKTAANGEQLPFMRRLGERYARNEIPMQHRPGVRRLLAVDQVARARSVLSAGNVPAARALVLQPFIIHAGRYCVRTLMEVLVASLFPIYLRRLSKP